MARDSGRSPCGIGRSDAGSRSPVLPKVCHNDLFALPSGASPCKPRSSERSSSIAFGKPWRRRADAARAGACASLEPAAIRRRRPRALDLTTEAAAFVARRRLARHRRARGPRDAVRRASTRRPAARAAAAARARPVRRFGDARRRRARRAHSSWPRLGRHRRARRPRFDDEIGAVRRAIEPSATSATRASPALRDIRDALRRQRAKLRSTLDGLARGRDTAKYLQDQIVTDRNGRYVLVVRAEHRDAIPGIVHGSSASGASLYLEPLVDRRAQQRRRRARRARAGGDPPHPARAHRRVPARAATNWTRRSTSAADFDELHAKSELARRVDGIAPALDRPTAASSSAARGIRC